MATWMIQDTELKEDGTEKGFQRLNATRNRDKDLKKKAIVFIDDGGVIHDDINTFSAARKAELIGEEQEKPTAKAGPSLTQKGWIEYTIELPPVAFYYFDVAKAHGFLKEGEEDLDHWILGCIQSRFIHEYGFVMALTPVSEDKEKDTEALMRQIAQEEIAKKEKAEEGKVESDVTHQEVRK